MASAALKLPNTVDAERGALKLIQQYIADGRDHYMMNVTVTPKIAEFLLQYNTAGVTNRRVRKGGIEMTAGALRDGVWLNTGEPIIMSDQKLLNDGQHRLMGIMTSGIPAIMDLRFGIKREAFAQTNSGFKRSAGDALEISGISAYYSKLATVYRLALAYEAGLPQSNFGIFPNDRIVAASKRWPDALEAMKYPASLGPKMWRSAAATLSFFAIRTANEASVRGFFQIMQTGEGDADNPPHRLRETMIRSNAHRDRNAQVRDLAICIIAWNAWRDNKKLTKLAWKSDQPYPKVNDLVL